MPRTNVESGQKNVRAQWVAETTTGQPPANPGWGIYSDTMLAAGPWNARADVFPLRGIGSVYPSAFLLGPESHSLGFQYYLQRAVGSDPLDDGLTRDADNLLPNSHTVVVREERTLDVGVDGGGARVYTVALGAYIGEGSIVGQAGTGEPVIVTLGYTPEKARSYRVDQPSAATLIGINSTNAADTTQQVTVENEGATTTQSATLSGTGLVSMGTLTYADIDAIALDLETVGDVEIWINTGSHATPTKGAVLCTIRGSANYDGIEGDLGIPLLGSGSNASAIAGSYEQFLSHTVERPAATSLAFSIVSNEFRFNNNLEIIPQVSSRRQRIIPGFATLEALATTFGEFESHARLEEALLGTELNFVWNLTSSTITLQNAILREPGDRVYNAGEATMQLGNTFEGRGIVVA